MRYVFFSSLILFLYTSSAAQTGLPDQLKNPVGFVYSDYSHPKFYYGIRKISEDLKSCQGVYLQAFEIISEIGYVRSTTSVRKPQIFLGFYGFDISMVTDWEPMKCKPSDTLIQPCVHTLISDVIIQNADILGIGDVSKCDLLVYNLFTDKTLYNLLNEKQPMPENCGGIFYLLWNKETKPQLPSFLSSSQGIKMAVNNPVKVPRKKLAFMESSSPEKTKTETPGNKKEKPPEKPPVSKVKQEVPKAKPAIPSKPAVPVAAGKTTLPPKVQATQQPPAVTTTTNTNTNTSTIISSPDISPSLLPDLQAFLRLKKIPFKAEENTLSLSAKNDTIIIRSKSKNSVISAIALPVNKIPVIFSQNVNNRRGYLPDPESRILNRSNMTKMTFCYKGQKLFFDKTGEKLFLPEIGSSATEIQVTSEIPASIEFARDKADTIKVLMTYEKFPLKLSILDTKFNNPVKGCPVRIIIKKKYETVQVNEEIYSLMLDSGDEIPDLYKNELIQYTMILDHPDFKQVIQRITWKDIETQKSILLEDQPSFVLLYVEPALMMRERIVYSLDKRKESLIRNNPHFLLFISNTDRPRVIYDSSEYTKSVHQISLMYDDKPNLEVDYQSLVDNLKNLDISSDSIKVNFYMSASLYRRDGKEFINRLVKDGISLVYNKDPEIYIFTDEPLVVEEKIDEIKYHYFTLKE